MALGWLTLCNSVSAVSCKEDSIDVTFDITRNAEFDGTWLIIGSTKWRPRQRMTKMEGERSIMGGGAMEIFEGLKPLKKVYCWI